MVTPKSLCEVPKLIHTWKEGTLALGTLERFFSLL